MKRYVLTLDLKDDPVLIEKYRLWHQNVWAEIKTSIKNSGIKSMNIYCVNYRLCMIIEVGNDFTFERKAKMDAENLVVQEWETLMLEFQNPAVVSAENKWQLMEEI